jgi:hypothetical protein
MRQPILLLVLAASLGAQKPEQGMDLEAAKQKAARLLVSWQERYTNDPAVGRFRTEEALDRWREKESKRLEELRRNSKANREWPYEGVYRIRVGGTSIVCWALMEAPGYAQDRERQKAVRQGFEFILHSFEHEPLLASGFKGGYDVRGWAHAYGLLALVKGLERGVAKESQVKRFKKTARWLVKALEETEIPKNGGWNYARRSRGGRAASPSSFMTASTLLALYEARAAGFKVSGDVVERALKALERGRATNGAYQYSIGGGGPGGTKVPGACARMAISETVLYLAGRSSDARGTLRNRALLLPLRPHLRRSGHRAAAEAGARAAPQGVARTLREDP